MKLSIIIPCFNEISTIERLLDQVIASPFQDKEIIVVDDFSTDGTRDLLAGALSGRINQVIFHDKNSGKGDALRESASSSLSK